MHTLVGEGWIYEAVSYGLVLAWFKGHYHVVICYGTCVNALSRGDFPGTIPCGYMVLYVVLAQAQSFSLSTKFVQSFCTSRNRQNKNHGQSWSRYL